MIFIVEVSLCVVHSVSFWQLTPGLQHCVALGIRLKTFSRTRHQGRARSQKRRRLGPFCQAPRFPSDRRSTEGPRREHEWRTHRATFYSRHRQPLGDGFTSTVHRRGLPLAVETVSLKRDEHKEGFILLTLSELTTTTRGI